MFSCSSWETLDNPLISAEIETNGESHVENTVLGFKKSLISLIAELAALPWLRKLMAFIQAYSSLLIFNW